MAKIKDNTVARMAGNIAAGLVGRGVEHVNNNAETIAKTAVGLVKAIVKELENDRRS